jgi:iron complex transport system substrate-binding protein
MSAVRRLAWIACAWAAALASSEARAADPQRIATLVPLVESAVSRIAGHAVLVASVRRWPGAPLPAGAADLGSPHAPSLEALYGAAPQLLVVDPVLNAGQIEKLSRADWKTLPIDTRTVESTLAGLVELGKRVGGEAEMQSAVSAVRGELSERRLAAPIRALSVFAAPGSPLVMTRRTWLGDLLEQLGFTDVAAAHSGSERMPGFVQLSAEVLASLEPEVMFVVAHGDPAELERSFLRDMQERAMWRGPAASTRGRVYVLPADLFGSNPGLDLPRAASWLLERAAAPPASGTAE